MAFSYSHSQIGLIGHTFLQLWIVNSSFSGLWYLAIMWGLAGDHVSFFKDFFLLLGNLKLGAILSLGPLRPCELCKFNPKPVWEQIWFINSQWRFFPTQFLVVTKMLSYHSLGFRIFLTDNVAVWILRILSSNFYISQAFSHVSSVLP